MDAIGRQSVGPSGFDADKWMPDTPFGLLRRCCVTVGTAELALGAEPFFVGFTRGLPKRNRVQAGSTGESVNLHRTSLHRMKIFPLAIRRNDRFAPPELTL